MLDIAQSSICISADACVVCMASLFASTKARRVGVDVVNKRRSCDEGCEQVKRDAQQTLTSDLGMFLISGRITVAAIWYQGIRSIIIVHSRLSSKSTGCNHYYKAGDTRRESGVLRS